MSNWLSHYFISGLLFVFLGCSAQLVTPGFLIVKKTINTQNMVGFFEAKAHTQELRHGRINLGEVGQCWISPSKNYALYEQGGKLRIFDANKQTTETIASIGQFGTPKNVVWNEMSGEVQITYGRDELTHLIRIKNISP